MPQKKQKQIFIVEDNEIYSMMLDYVLSKNSIYKFVHFKSGEDCIENLNLNPDIIILDYGLPGMDGYETLLEIKRQNPRIQVVIITSNEDEELKGKLFLAGADDYILKQDLVGKQVIEKIENILNKQGSESGNSSKMKKKLVYYFLLIAILLAMGIYYYI